MKTRIIGIQVSRNLLDTKPMDKYAVVSRGNGRVRRYSLTGSSGLRIYNMLDMVDSCTTWQGGSKYQTFYYKPANTPDA